jgi:type I restriction enzyme S subunit
MRETLVKSEEFKDSPWGKLPQNWEIKTLGELANNNGEYGSGSAALEFNPDLPRYVRITDITDEGNLDPNSCASITREDAKGYYLQEGDLLFARSGATVGKTYLYNQVDGECAHAGYVIKFTLNSDLCNHHFVSQWTRSSR